MRVLKPAWVSHEGKPIFSVDIHPDGSRLATGGQGDDYGKIVIWNMEPVRNEADEENEKVPKVLCQMDNHYACVNCVRWSHNGKFLASGGDDKLIMIWQTSRGAGPTKVFGSTGSVNIVEPWRPVFTLRGHTGDVLDLSWSPQDVWLATCSVDNTIIIWNALKFPEQITVLKGHTGLVKGVTWDPVGTYVATQSDDRSLRVWRTMDWVQESVITEPFKDCGGTTHALRLNWSPDGHHIVSAHAMNNSGPTAQIIERQGFKASLDFVGHRKAITVVRFNPNIFSKKSKVEKAPQYSCCAIGSKDRSLSIWLTALKRPLVVMHELFENSILDLSWGRNGLELMSCSLDGTVAYMDFTVNEIGQPLSKDEVVRLIEKIYGKRASLEVAASKGSQIIESAALLNLQEEQKNKQEDMMTPSKNSSLSLQMSASGDGTPFKPRDKQIETRTADGKRRITPIFLAPQPEVGEVPLPFSTNSNIEFHSSSEKSKIVVEKQNRVTAPGMLSPMSGGSKSMPSPPSAMGAVMAGAGAAGSAKDGAPGVQTSPSQQALACKLANETTPEKQKSQSYTSPGKDSVVPDKTSPQEKVVEKRPPPPPPPAIAAVTTPSSMTPVVLPLPSDGADKSKGPQSASKDKDLSVSNKDKDQSASNKDKDLSVSSKDKDLSASSKEKMKSKIGGSLTLKRKYGEEHKKYVKRGRPTKSEQAAREAAMAATAAVAVEDIGRSATAGATSVPATTVVPPAGLREHQPVSSVPKLKLPPLSIEKHNSVVIHGQVGDANSLVLEVENNIDLGVTKVHRLRCTMGSRVIWDQMLNSQISAICGSKHLACVACKDGTVSIFSSNGRRIFPYLMTSNSPPSVFCCSNHHVMFICTKGKLFVWNSHSRKAEIKQQSLADFMSVQDKLERAIVTSEGIPVITLGNKKSYSFIPDLGCWIVTNSGDDKLQSCSNHHRCTPSKHPPIGPLSSLQQHFRPSDQAFRAFQSNPGAHQTLTLSHLESQIAASFSLKSANEYRFWLETYIRYLSQEGLEAKLRESCDELLGPVYQSSSKSWSKYVLGVDKHSILRSVLPSVGADLRFQRLYTEYTEQLDMNLDG